MVIKPVIVMGLVGCIGPTGVRPQASEAAAAYTKLEVQRVEWGKGDCKEKVFVYADSVVMYACDNRRVRLVKLDDAYLEELPLLLEETLNDSLVEDRSNSGQPTRWSYYLKYYGSPDIERAFVSSVADWPSAQHLSSSQRALLLLNRIYDDVP